MKILVADDLPASAIELLHKEVWDIDARTGRTPEQLANDLAHQSDDEAHDTLARLPGVSSATIDYDTGPFPRRMPWLASHIRIEIAER